jgi:hypothetical protein
MKPVFDPKWLPKLEEVDVPVHLVVLGEMAREDIRELHRLCRDLPIVEAPLVPFPTPIVTDPTRYVSPMIGYDPGSNGTAVAIVSGMQSLKFIPLSSIDLSEYAAPETKSAINKALRKKRDAQKASQNAKGRKWWEHR